MKKFQELNKSGFRPVTERSPELIFIIFSLNHETYFRQYFSSEWNLISQKSSVTSRILAIRMVLGKLDYIFPQLDSIPEIFQVRIVILEHRVTCGNSSYEES